MAPPPPWRLPGRGIGPSVGTLLAGEFKSVRSVALADREAVFQFTPKVVFVVKQVLNSSSVTGPAIATGSLPFPPIFDRAAPKPRTRQ
jgi:hypothetical protein